MPKLRVLSGEEVIKILNSFGFIEVKRKGSHIKLKRINNDHSETLTVPDHKELGKGTIKAIFNQASRYISESELRSNFYN